MLWVWGGRKLPRFGRRQAGRARQSARGDRAHTPDRIFAPILTPFGGGLRWEVELNRSKRVARVFVVGRVRVSQCSCTSPAGPWELSVLCFLQASVGHARTARSARLGAIGYGWWRPPREAALWCLSDLALVHCMIWGRAPTRPMVVTRFNTPTSACFGRSCSLPMLHPYLCTPHSSSGNGSCIFSEGTHAI